MSHSMTEAMTQVPLQTKTYFSTTVEAALDLARRELGVEAMLVNSRPAPEQMRHLGRYEVIFATATEPESARAPHVPAVAAAGSSHSSVFRRLLESNGVEPALARDLIYTVLRQNSASATRESLLRALRSEMESRLKVDSRFGAIVALIGPPGRGKTTTVMKLAVLEGLAKRIPVRILSVDHRRVGAADRLRSLASALGVPFQLCGSVDALDQELRIGRGREAGRPGLTLIDTPGHGPRDFAEGVDLAGYFASHPDVDVQLVLRADAKSADLIRTAQKYSSFGGGKLVFTGMDEIETSGSVFSAIAQLDQSVSFLGFGQRIPGDIEAASKARIVLPIFKGWEEKTLAAA
jgi:flagellar biosynthesis protein FlhF